MKMGEPPKYSSYGKYLYSVDLLEPVAKYDKKTDAFIVLKDCRLYIEDTVTIDGIQYMVEFIKEKK